jgi:hypothetical protein
MAVVVLCHVRKMARNSVHTASSGPWNPDIKPVLDSLAVEKPLCNAASARFQPNAHSFDRVPSTINSESNVSRARPSSKAKYPAPAVVAMRELKGDTSPRSCGSPHTCECCSIVTPWTPHHSTRSETAEREGEGSICVRIHVMATPR